MHADCFRKCWAEKLLHQSSMLPFLSKFRPGRGQRRAVRQALPAQHRPPLPVLWGASVTGAHVGQQRTGPLKASRSHCGSMALPGVQTQISGGGWAWSLGTQAALGRGLRSSSGRAPAYSGCSWSPWAWSRATRTRVALPSGRRSACQTGTALGGGCWLPWNDTELGSAAGGDKELLHRSPGQCGCSPVSQAQGEEWPVNEVESGSSSLCPEQEHLRPCGTSPDTAAAPCPALGLGVPI